MFVGGVILEGKERTLNLFIRTGLQRRLHLGDGNGVIRAADILQVRAAVELQFDELANDGYDAVCVPATPSLSDDTLSRFEAHDTSLHRLTADDDHVYPDGMGTSLQYYIAATYRPSTNLIEDIDAARHPNVARWVETGGYDDRYTASSLGWLAGYRKFGDIFERAAHLTPNFPENSFADPWNLIGMWEGKFSQNTLRWFTMVLSPSAIALPHLIASFKKLGDVPENLFGQNEWGRGKLTSFAAPVRTLKSYPEAILGGLARSWVPDNIDELMAYRVAAYQVKHLVEELYPDVKFDQPGNETVVPFEVVRAGLIEKTPIEYLKAMLG